jgi:hypothetical protein
LQSMLGFKQAIFPVGSRNDWILCTCIVPWWNREWWEMPMYRYWESYRWKEETDTWSPEWLIRYSTVPCYNDDFRPWK